MARGFVSGVIWGTIVGGLGLAGLSLVGSRVGPPAPAPVAGTEVGALTPVSGDEVPQIPAALAGEDARGAPDPAQPAPAAGEVPGGDGDPARPAVADGGAEAVAAPGEDDGAGAPGEEAGVTAPTPLTGVPVVPGQDALPGAGVRPEMPQVQEEAAAGLTGAGEAAPPVAGAAADPDVTAALPGMPGAVGGGETPPETDAAPIPRTSIIGEPVTPVGDRAENVVTGRLPSIGGDEAEAEETGDLVLLEPAIRRNAAQFIAEGNNPLMSVLLVDVPEARDLLGDLKNLPFATSFVVDADAADAAEAIAFYRGLGAEVVLSIPLPAGATPGDIEVILQVHGALLDQAVAMLVPAASGFQTLGPAARQVAVVLQATGHGLISLPQGLNTGHKAALKEGVPAGLIFSELDNDGQTGAVIRRFVDNAAFRARQEEAGVILLAHARPETIQALIEWSFGNRAQSVTMAPVSAVLVAGAEG